MTITKEFLTRIDAEIATLQAEVAALRAQHSVRADLARAIAEYDGVEANALARREALTAAIRARVEAVPPATPNVVPVADVAPVVPWAKVDAALAPAGDVVPETPDLDLPPSWKRLDGGVA